MKFRVGDIVVCIDYPARDAINLIGVIERIPTPTLCVVNFNQKYHSLVMYEKELEFAVSHINVQKLKEKLGI